jgi:hypothetical protein
VTAREPTSQLLVERSLSCFGEIVRFSVKCRKRGSTQLSRA